MASAKAEASSVFEATSLSSSNKVRIRSSSLGQKAIQRKPWPQSLNSQNDSLAHLIHLFQKFAFTQTYSNENLSYSSCKSLLLFVLNGDTKLLQPFIQETDDSLIIFTGEENPSSNTRKSPRRKLRNTLHTTPAVVISTQCTLLRAKFSRAIMQRITLISTGYSLHGPNRGFRESPLNFGTRRSSSEISATKDLNGRQTNQAKSFSNLGKFLPQVKTRRNPFLAKPGRLKFLRNKTIIINLILFPPSPVPRMILY